MDSLAKSRTETRTTPPGSSSKTTTELPHEWTNINFDGLSEYGFNKTHILQASKLGVISAGDLQQAINYFVFDLLENNKENEI